VRWRASSKGAPVICARSGSEIYTKPEAELEARKFGDGT